MNRALAKIFPERQAAGATRLEDLFSREDTAEIKYLMKRARRTGAASGQLELRTASRKLQLAVTVSALEEKLTSGFVVVLEDTSELLRAQKAAAWHEVARRVAHEIKNPLTPIALSAERIGRQMERLDLPPASARILNECAATISKSVESVKTLVDEFSQFARFPAAQPVRSDLNDVVREALAIFQDRLDGIAIQTSFAAGPAAGEPGPRAVPARGGEPGGQRRRSHAGFAGEEPVRSRRSTGAAETVELVVADSGCGVSPDDKEKLFLPYFSTKNRGTGLGLAIVSHIVAEHGGAHPRGGQPARWARASRWRFRRWWRPRARRGAPPAGGRQGMKTAAHSGGGRRAGHPPVPGRRAGRRRLRGGGRRRAAKPAWRRCRAASFELVLLDIWLPGMDGMEVLARIQEIPVRRAARGGDDLRPRQHRGGRQGHQAGRLRFSGKAALHRKSLGGGEERAGAPQPGAREQPAEGRQRRALPHHRRERAHEGAAPAAGA